MAVGYQSFYQAQLTSNISDSDLTIPLDVAPTVDEGFLVIESTVTNKREIIYYTSKTSNSVTCPSGAGNGRGYDGTTATDHLQGAAVIMAPVGAMFSELRTQFTTTPQGWTSLVPTVTAVSANGNRSYTLTHDSSIASVVSPGMRRRFTRTVAAPNTAFSLDGSNDYYNKTSPSGMTFTDDFVVSAWVYMTAYPSVNGAIASRYNGTSGWSLQISSSGQIYLYGLNGGSGNYSVVYTYQSVPLNRWVHIAAQLDMSTFTATTTTSYVMIDEKDVPAIVARAGSNPTQLVQAGNLEIGSSNGGGSLFTGYIDQVAIYSAKVTQATILASISQKLTGSETSLISAYSNGSTTDLSANANNLTAQNGATTANKSPFGNNGVSTTLEYGLTMSVSSDGLTEVVQVPEGCAIPTTGGVSASAYSTMANPYGWPNNRKFAIRKLNSASYSTGTSAGTWYDSKLRIDIPVGDWSVMYDVKMTCARAGSAYYVPNVTLSSDGSTETNASEWTSVQEFGVANGTTVGVTEHIRRNDMNIAAMATYYILLKNDDVHDSKNLSRSHIEITPSGL